MVAVRVLALLVPEENVTVALPDASLTPLDALRKPLSAENVTGTPDTAAFEALTTVAVIVAELLLSDATDVSEELTLIADAMGTGTGAGAGVDVPEPPPPQAPKRPANISEMKQPNVLDEILITCTPTTSRSFFGAFSGFISPSKGRASSRLRKSEINEAIAPYH